MRKRKFAVSEEHKKIAKKLLEYEEKVKKLLPQQESEKIIYDYSALQSALVSEAESSGFAEGFKIGLLIGAEVFGSLSKE